jgi:hypothetical protein
MAFQMLVYSRVGQNKCGQGPEVSFNGIMEKQFIKL